MANSLLARVEEGLQKFVSAFNRGRGSPSNGEPVALRWLVDGEFAGLDLRGAHG